MNTLYDTAMRLLFTPYLWGGDDFSGFDCSGLVQELLLTGGAHPSPGRDYNAQMLYDFFSQPENHFSKDRERGALAFYRGRHAQQGSLKPSIIHVTWLIDQYRMIEAGGGGSSTTSLQAAIKQNAYVRIRPIRDEGLVGVFMPDYAAIEL